MADYLLSVSQDTNVQLTLNNGGSVPADPILASTLSGFALTAVWFVDANTLTPLADQTGAIGRPFATVNQAFAAAQADFTANARRQVIMITPDDYSAEAAPVGTNYSLTIRCWRPFMPNGGSQASPQPIGLATLNALASTADLLLEGVLFITGPVSALNLTLKGAFCAQSVTAETIRCYEGSQTGDATTTVGDSVWDGCVLPATITQAVGSVCRIRNCDQTAACAVTGDLQIDGYSNSFQTITATGTLTVAERQARETLSIVVPAVLAGDVGYVSTAFVGELATIPQFAPLVGNPQADLVAAGVGGGFVNCWADVAGSVRCSFVGPLAGGAVNFTFARV